MERESWLPAAPESAPLARSIVRESATRSGLDGDAIWDLMLATTEAVANALEHGSPCGESEQILLRVLSCGEVLYVEVCDCGDDGGALAEFDPEDPGPANFESTAGRGLPIIAAVVDLMEIRPGAGETRVRFGKRVVAA